MRQDNSINNTVLLEFLGRLCIFILLSIIIAELFLKNCSSIIKIGILIISVIILLWSYNIGYIESILKNNKATIFVNHIEKHLKENKKTNKKVICKICNKDIDKIYNENKEKIICKILK